MAMSDEQVQAHCDQLFDQIDTNHNGALENDEFKNFCRQAVPDMTEAEMDSDWKDLDLNADQRVDKGELLKFLKKKLQ